MMLWLATLILVVACAGIPFFIEQGRLRFPLRFLFIATAYIALGCAVVLSRSDLWFVLLGPASFGSIATAVLGVIYRRDKRRTFWVGFLVFGSVYIAMLWLIGFSPPLSGDVNGALVLHIPIALIGSHISRYFQTTMDKPPSDVAG
jgi:hypothetical protein